MAALDKLNAGERVMGAGAVVLLISLCLPWFGTAEEENPFIPPARKVTINAWESFDVSDLILCLVALGTLAAIVATLRGVGAGREPRTLLGVLVAALVTVGIVFAGIENPIENTTTRFGLWVGLLAAIAIAAGAWMAYKRLDQG